jgi:hypothetical protein
VIGEGPRTLRLFRNASNESKLEVEADCEGKLSLRVSLPLSPSKGDSLLFSVPKSRVLLDDRNSVASLPVATWRALAGNFSKKATASSFLCREM